MNRIYVQLVLLSAVALAATACHKQQDPVSELEKAASSIAKSEPAPAAPEPGAAPAVPPAKQVQEAIAEYKAGQMEDAVTRLQLLRATPALSPEQRMALQDSIAAVMTEVYSLAEKGDARAIAAKAKYEAMQNRQ